MTEGTHTQLDHICTEICELCRHSAADLDEEGCPCNDCRPLIDLANLLVRLENAAPPREGETVWVIAHDCDSCPHTDEEAYKYCESCCELSACPEVFSASETLDLWYRGQTYRSEAAALSALAERQTV